MAERLFLRLALISIIHSNFDKFLPREMKKRELLLVVIATVSVLSSCKQRIDSNAGLNDKPNILLIVADDLGYSDIESFGGNIQTPVITGLAKEGL